MSNVQRHTKTIHTRQMSRWINETNVVIGSSSCVCVCEREREREREIDCVSLCIPVFFWLCGRARARVCMWLCVSVWAYISDRMTDNEAIKRNR